jgi:hypothetical protein
MKSNIIPGKLILLNALGITALVFLILVSTAGAMSSFGNNESSKGLSNENASNVSGPVPNPYLASSLYSITHFDSSQSDSIPYGPLCGVFTIDPTTKPIVYGGPINIMTLASTDKDYMWAVGTDRVSYVNIEDDNWTVMAEYEALANATNNQLPAVPNKNFSTFGKSSAVGMNATSMNIYLKSFFGENYSDRFGNGGYSVVDNKNILYVNYGNNIYAFALKNPCKPSEGIKKCYMIEDVVTAIQGKNHLPSVRVSGLSMTYDGHLIITFSNGIAVVDRDLNTTCASFCRFNDSEYVSNSIAVDENNGIYVASNSVMYKLVWTGTKLSDDEADGAWSQEYTSSVQPPMIKFGNGTGSTPTLMGFGNDKDKLVVITDGAKRMNLVAFWRDEIPNESQRTADQIQVTCGLPNNTKWIQSEQSVVVYGYGVFVVNNIPKTFDSNLVDKNKILQVSLMGPASPASYGAERFQWNTSTHKWSSVWSRSDVSSTSMVPIHSVSGNMALINGYQSPDGWEVLGLDWDTGKTVHKTVCGDLNFGNGAYAILQYLDNHDLVFNSISGPIRIHYDQK